jgi:hypothetical protein
MADALALFILKTVVLIRSLMDKHYEWREVPPFIGVS